MTHNKPTWKSAILMELGCLLIASSGCTIEDKAASTKIDIDGSSTVYPVSYAVVEEYLKTHPDAEITVSQSGTGGGFEKFARGDTVISDASRPIKPKEAEACKTNGIKYIELQVGIDGLTVMVNPQNDWCDALTVEQLKKIWSRGSEVKKWSDVDPSWPEEEIKLFGPGTESGTYDYFVEEICGKETGSRSDYEASSKDNVLVEGIAGEQYALGYFGYAYYIENQERLKALAISPTDSIEDGVLPNNETVEKGEYTPLSRPLFIYVNTGALQRPEVAEFVDFYINKGQAFVEEKGYVTLKPAVLETMKQRLADAKSGKSVTETETAETSTTASPESKEKSPE